MPLITALPQSLAVCGAGVLSARGRGWRGQGAACAASGSGVVAAAADLGAAVSDSVLVTAEAAAGGPSRKQRSRAARLAAVAMRDAIVDAGWTDADAGREVGAFLGVGSSGGGVAELAAVVSASLADGALSLQRFGAAGLGAASPLFAFQLLNNFTLCHGAIQAGLGGPSSALFSRGGGTVLALQEAAWAILDGDCPRALAGGADTALYAVTHAELRRAGLLAAGLLPGEGAAVLALARDAPAARARLTTCTLLPCGDPGLALDGRVASPLPESTLLAVDAALASQRATPPDAVVLLAFSAVLREALHTRVQAAFPAARILDVVSVLGDALAGGPALAWAVGLDLLESAAVERVLVLSVGLDADVGVVGLQRGTR